MGRRWYGVEDAAQYLGFKVSYMYRMAEGRAATKGPPVTKVGGLLRYDIKDLDRWIDAQPRRNGMK